MRIIAYSGNRMFKHIKNLGKLVMQLTGSPVKFFKNAKNKILLKIKWTLNAEIQANRGAHFLHLTCQAGWRAPLPLPAVTPVTTKLPKESFAPQIEIRSAINQWSWGALWKKSAYALQVLWASLKESYWRPFESVMSLLTHYICYCGPLCKRRTYTLQLLFGAPLKA